MKYQIPALFLFAGFCLQGVSTQDSQESVVTSTDSHVVCTSGSPAIDTNIVVGDPNIIQGTYNSIRGTYNAIQGSGNSVRGNGNLVGRPDATFDHPFAQEKKIKGVNVIRPTEVIRRPTVSCEESSSTVERPTTRPVRAEKVEVSVETTSSESRPTESQVTETRTESRPVESRQIESRPTETRTETRCVESRPETRIYTSSAPRIVVVDSAQESRGSTTSSTVYTKPIQSGSKMVEVSAGSKREPLVQYTSTRIPTRTVATQRAVPAKIYGSCEDSDHSQLSRKIDRQLSSSADSRCSSCNRRF